MRSEIDERRKGGDLLGFLVFKSACNYATRVKKNVGSQYYTQLIPKNSSDQKKTLQQNKVIIKRSIASVIGSITVGNDVIQADTCVKNLGSWFDSTLTMSTRITIVCGAALYHLRNIRRSRKYLSTKDAKTLVNVLITPCLDYCNSLKLLQ